ncbi:MAG: heavy-metal-associated domain-containing protein [Phycisphaerales bacterium]|nr:heavy-metal-associated domain-containing protein [Phycisphaerales bacterium]
MTKARNSTMATTTSGSLATSRGLSWLGAAAAAAAAAACIAGMAAGWRAAGSTAASAMAATSAAAPCGATELELGREVCGECCETRIWSAIGSLPGVRDVVVERGSSKIVVHHDAAGSVDRLVAGLREKEYPEARRIGAAADAQGRVWIRPVAPPR